MCWKVGGWSDGTYVLQWNLHSGHRPRLPKLCAAGITAARSAPSCGDSRAPSASPARLTLGGRLDVLARSARSPSGASSGRTEEATTFITRSRRSRRPLTTAKDAVLDGKAVALVDRRRHDQVDRAALVLEQHEDDPLARSPAAGGRRPSRRPRPSAAVGAPARSALRADPPLEAGAQQRHRVLAERRSRSTVVGDQPLPASRARAGDGAAGRLERERQLDAPAAAPRPALTPSRQRPSRRRRPSRPPMPSQRPGPGQPLEARAAGAGARGEVGDPA